MDTFYQTFGWVAALCSGIIILAVFFTALSYFRRVVSGPGVIAVKGFIRDGKWVCVQLTGGRALERVRFVGFAGQAAAKGGGIPYQLQGMAVFETAQGSRILVRADSIRLIEEVVDS